MDSRGGFEDVDAIAAETGRGRLRQRLQTGTLELAGGRPSALPSQAITLDRETCLLAVAVQGDGGGPIVMRTPSGSHGDLRRRTFAATEICGDELGGDPPAIENLELVGESSGRTRWGFYRTSRLLPGTAPAGGPEAEPAPRPFADPEPKAPAPAPEAEPAPIGKPAEQPAAEEASEAPRADFSSFPDLESPKAAVRSAAIALIVARQEQTAVTAVLELAASDPDVGVRLKACRAVGDLGDRSDVAALEEVRMGDRNRKVRKAAEQAIRKLLRGK
jgi:hypothetical protein